MDKNINVAVSCIGGEFTSQNIALMKEVEGHSINIIGLDANPLANGRFLCEQFEVVPLPHNELKYIESIKKIITKHKVKLIVPLSEDESRCLAKHKEEFMNMGTYITVPHLEIVDTLTDKYQMLNFFHNKGIEVGPFSKVDNLEDFHLSLEKLNYPEDKVVMKPRKSSGSRGVLILDKAKKTYEAYLSDRVCGTGDLDSILEVIKEKDISFKDYVAMPFFGEEVFDVDCLLKDGSPVNIVPRKRKYDNPLSPVNQGCEILSRRDVQDYVSLLCEALGGSGTFDFDIAVGKKGEVRLLDAGTRMSGSVCASNLAGVNIPAQLIRILFNLPLVDYGDLKDGIYRPMKTFVKANL